MASSDLAGSGHIAETIPEVSGVARPAGRVQAAAAALNPGFLLIVALAALVRLWDVNWDQNTHQHPDERSLTMMGIAAHIPSTLWQYFDPATSPLNPANIGCVGVQCPYRFFVYGTLPVTLNKLIAQIFGNDNYNGFVLEGRVLSAIADVGVVVLVYLIVRLLEDRYGLPSRLKYLAAFLYAISVLPIQLAHFFAVDTFLNVFVIGSFYFALRYSFRPTIANAVGSALCLGLALGSKITGLAVVPLDAAVMLAPHLEQAGINLTGSFTSIRTALANRKRVLPVSADVLFILLVYIVVTYASLRIADPYVFQSASWLDPRPSTLFVTNLQELAALTTPAAWYPPAVQWIHKPPVIFSLVNVAFFGLGLPLFLCAVAGALTRPARSAGRLIVVAIWVALFFLFQSAQFAATMRYFIFLYPFFAIFAAFGLYWLVRRTPLFFRSATTITLLIWPLAFMSIYLHPESRVQASAWMNAHLPNGSYVLSESWDDALPLQGTTTFGRYFTGASLPVFDPDTAKKWQTMDAMLRKGDYLVLSSNRGWGSIPTVPERYPRMIRFYHRLFAGKTAYREIARFTSYPSLRWLGIPIDFPDQWAEEAFTVYDHQEVIIFEHVR